MSENESEILLFFFFLCRLYMRLALLMGISWIMGIVAGFVDVSILWIIFILFNTLQGLFIFLAFTCTAKVRRVLKSKLCSSSPSPANASWTWSGIGTNGNKNIMGRTTSSSSANTKRSELDSRDSNESHHSVSHNSVSVRSLQSHRSSLNSLHHHNQHLYGTPSNASYMA